MPEKVVGILEFDASQGKLSVRQFTQSTKAQLTELENKSGSTAKKMTSDMKGAFVAITAALTIFSVAAISAFNDVEVAMRRIRAGTGKTGDELKQLKKDFHEVFGDVPEDARIVGKVIADLNTRLGLTGKPLQDLSKKFLDLSRIMEQDITQVLPAATRMFGDWNITADKTSGALDKVFRASQNSGASITYLMEQVVNFGAPLRNLGYNFEQSLAIIGKWEKEGVNFQTVMSGMRMAVAYFGKEGINAKEGLNDLIYTIKNTDEETGKLAAKTIVGQRAFNDFYDAVKGGKFELDKLVDSINNKYGDSINKAAADSETTAERIEKAWRNLQEQLARVGEALKPLLEAFAWLLERASDVLKFFNDLGERYTLTGEALKEYYTLISEQNDKTVKKVMEGTEELTKKEIEEAQKRIQIATEEANARIRIFEEQVKKWAEVARRNSSSGNALADVSSAARMEAQNYSKELQQLRAQVDSNNEIMGEFNSALQRIAETGSSVKKIMDDVGTAVEGAGNSAGEGGKEIGGTEAYFKSLADEITKLETEYSELSKTFRDYTIYDKMSDKVKPLIQAYKDWHLSLPPLLEQFDRYYQEQDKIAKIEDTVQQKLKNGQVIILDTKKDWNELGDTAVNSAIKMLETIPLIGPTVAGMLKGMGESIKQGINSEVDGIEIDTSDVSEPVKLGKRMANAFKSGFIGSLHNIGDIFTSFGIGIGDAATEALESSIGKWVKDSKFFSQFFKDIIGSLMPVLGSAIGEVAGNFLNKVGGWIKRSITGPSNEELFADFGTKAGTIFGDSWNDAAQAKMLELAEKLPRASSGKFDFVAAMFHPETVNEMLKALDSIGPAIQNKFAGIFERDVRSVLQNTLKLSDEEAAAAMGPLFQTVIDKAIQYGEALTPEMNRMLEWAKNMGVEIEFSTDIFVQSFTDLIGKESISVEKLQNMRILAEQLGVEIDGVLVKGMEDFFNNANWSVDALENILTAAKKAGYDVDSIFVKAIENANDELKRLQNELSTFGNSYLNWFDRKLALQDQANSLRESFESSAADKYYKEWEKNNRKRLSGLKDEERSQVEKEARQDAENKAKERYFDIQKRVNQLNLDGKHDLRDIREMLRGLPKDEKELALEMAKTRYETEQHKLALQEIKEKEKEIRDLIKKQQEKVKDLQTAEERVKTVTEQIRDTTAVWRDEIDKIYKNWKWMYEHPINTEGTSSGKNRAGGGIISYGRYTVGEEGPEYIIDNPTLNRFGTGFFDSLRNGYVPFSQSGSTNSVKVVLEVKKEPGSIKIIPTINSKQIGEAIDFEIIDQIATELETRDKIVTK